MEPPARLIENTILLVTQQKSLVKKITSLLESEMPGMELLVTDSGVNGLHQIYRTPPGLTLVDSTLADVSGLQLCRVLKHDPTIRKLPIILITKQSAREYERYSELSLVADAFLEEKALNHSFISTVKMLVNVYRGLDEEEKQQLRLLQQEAIRVQPINRLVQLYDQAITEVTVMQGFRKLFERVQSPNVLVHMLFSLLGHLLDYDIAAVFFNDRNRSARLLSFHIADNFDVGDDQLKAWTDQVFQELKQQSAEPWTFSATRFETVKADYQETGTSIQAKHRSFFPFFIESTLVGALVFYNRKEVNYQLIFPFSLIMQETSSLMRMRRYHSEAEMLTITDSLTGLYTHQHFVWALDREVRQSKRHKNPLTLACISLDDFQELNSQWGHQIGDQAMVSLAGVLLENVRNIDILSRSGTRTIMALFPNTDPKSSSVALARVQKVLKKTPLMWDGTAIPLTVTIGVAGLTEAIANAADFMAHAQKALEQARQKGHNRVELLQ